MSLQITFIRYLFCSRWVLIALFLISSLYAVDSEKNNNICYTTNGDKGKENKEDEEDKDDEDDDKDEDEDDEPIKVGNFSVRSSQQPAPLVGFGEKVMPKGLYQIQFLSQSYFGNHRRYLAQDVAILYGITDRLSILFDVPVALESKYDSAVSAGIQDVFVVMEYAYYLKNTKTTTDQATILAAAFAPSGDPDANPALGLGTPSFFIGTTYIHTNIDWFIFGCLATLFNEPRHRIKHGNVSYYQLGFGRNFWTPPNWLYAWMVEFDGTYTKNDVFDGLQDPDSGGNIIYATPSLFISSEHLIFQAGLGYAIQQSLKGNQNRQNCLLIGQISWTY